jgi:hypothetical protein
VARGRPEAVKVVQVEQPALPGRRGSQEGVLRAHLAIPFRQAICSTARWAHQGASGPERLALVIAAEQTDRPVLGDRTCREAVEMASRLSVGPLAARQGRQAAQPEQAQVPGRPAIATAHREVLAPAAA